MSKPIEKLVEDGKLDIVEKVLNEDLAPTTEERAEPAAATFAVSIDRIAQLKMLREPAPPNYISSLPKQTKAQKEALQADRTKGIRCGLCHGWHHKDATHVPYVGHAAVTDRLLTVDPFWSWEPVAWTSEGLPRLDASGGMWIRLTVGGVTRLGYGHGAQKPGQDPGAREKEVIGDAIRNAAMRFGVALELWHKGELHPDGEGATDEVDSPAQDATADAIANAPEGMFISDEQRDRILAMAASAGVEARAICDRFGIDSLPQLHADSFDALIESLKLTAEKRRKAQTPITDDILDDKIPY